MKIKALRFISLTLGAASLSENTSDQISNLEFRVYRVFFGIYDFGFDIFHSIG